MNPRKHTIEMFIEKARRVHGNLYDYDEVEYFNSATPVRIRCFEHGIFEQTPSGHLQGNKCKKCRKLKVDEIESRKVEKISQKWKRWTNKFILESRAVHGDRYDYCKVEYRGRKTKVCIICPDHGEFWQAPVYHLKGCKCSRCRMSKGETMISVLLSKWNIPFKFDKRFSDCRGIGGNPLSFDFHLPDHNILIEFDGMHHYGRGQYHTHKLNAEDNKRITEHDRRKTNYAMFNGIKMVRIPYFKMNKIEEILKEELYGKK